MVGERWPLKVVLGRIWTMSKLLTADDILPLVACLTPEERVRLLRLVASSAGTDAAIYASVPPTPGEFSKDEEPLAWSCFGLIDEQPGRWVETKSRQVERCAQEITSEPVKALGVGGIDGGLNVNGEAGISPRKEQVDALSGDELAALEEFENLVPEEELGSMGIDVGNGKPGAVIEKNPASDDGVDMGIPLERRGKGLYDGHHTGPGIGFVDGSGHQPFPETVALLEKLGSKNNHKCVSC